MTEEKRKESLRMVKVDEREVAQEEGTRQRRR